MSHQTAALRIAHLAHAVAGEKDYVIDQLTRKTYPVQYQDLLLTDTGQSTIYIPEGVTCIAAKLTPIISAAQHDTNYVTVNVGYDNGAAGGWTSLQSITSKITGGVAHVAGTAIALASIGPLVSIAGGKHFGMLITKAGAGILVAYNLTLDCRLT